MSTKAFPDSSVKLKDLFTQISKLQFNFMVFTPKEISQGTKTLLRDSGTKSSFQMEESGTKFISCMMEFCGKTAPAPRVVLSDSFGILKAEFL